MTQLASQYMCIYILNDIWNEIYPIDNAITYQSHRYDNEDILGWIFMGFDSDLGFLCEKNPSWLIICS